VTAVEATQLGGAVLSLVVAIVIPIYLIRRSERRADRERDAAGEAVTMVALNAALVKERDKLQVELKEVKAEWSRKYDQLRDELEAEAAQAKRQYEAEHQALRQRIKHLKQEIDDLNQRLWTGKGPPRPQTDDE